MARYWHIAHPNYTTGDDLTCRNQLAQEGRAPEWAWGDAPEGFDGDVICLFPDADTGRQEADWLWYERQDHLLLAVDLDDDTQLVTVEEGYPAVLGSIPADRIRVVATEYTEGVIA